MSAPWSFLGLAAVQLSPLHSGQQGPHAEVGPQSLHVIVVGHVEARQQVDVGVHSLYCGHCISVLSEK